MAALEIGTSRTVVCVGEVEKAGDRVRITGYGVSKTSGVRKGQIEDISLAQESVRSAMEKAAAALPNVDIGEVMLSITGGHFQASPHEASLATPKGVVKRMDIEELNEIVDSIPVNPLRQVLHTLRQKYIVDDKSVVQNPETHSCNILTLNKLAIHGLKRHIDNAITAVKGSNKLEVTDVIFAGIGAATSVLTPEQKERGVVLIDLGGGTTTYMVYGGGVLIAAGCIALGGDHVTNDIDIAFPRLGSAKAEELKCTEGSALIGKDDESQRIMVQLGLMDLDKLYISRRALNTVINARMDELFAELRDRLSRERVPIDLGTDVVLTGGGAYLRGVEDVARHVLGMPCTIGLPQNVDWAVDVEQPASFATVAGMLMYGHANYKQMGLFSSCKNWFENLFKGAPQS